jgi:hypothetical protein
MISLNVFKSLSRPLVLVSASLLFQTGGALAADRGADAQTQARELLSRTTASQSAALSASSVGKGSLSAIDPHEQARRLVLGAPAQRSEGTSPSGIAVRREARPSADAHAIARRMILGRVG